MSCQLGPPVSEISWGYLGMLRGLLFFQSPQKWNDDWHQCFELYLKMSCVATKHDQALEISMQRSRCPRSSRSSSFCWPSFGRLGDRITRSQGHATDLPVRILSRLLWASAETKIWGARSCHVEIQLPSHKRGCDRWGVFGSTAGQPGFGSFPQPNDLVGWPCDVGEAAKKVERQLMGGGGVFFV